MERKHDCVCFLSPGPPARVEARWEDGKRTRRRLRRRGCWGRTTAPRRTGTRCRVGGKTKSPHKWKPSTNKEIRKQEIFPGSLEERKTGGPVNQPWKRKQVNRGTAKQFSLCAPNICPCLTRRRKPHPCSLSNTAQDSSQGICAVTAAGRVRWRLAIYSYWQYIHVNNIFILPIYSLLTTQWSRVLDFTRTLSSMWITSKPSSAILLASLAPCVFFFSFFVLMNSACMWAHKSDSLRPHGL